MYITYLYHITLYIHIYIYTSACPDVIYAILTGDIILRDRMI